MKIDEFILNNNIKRTYYLYDSRLLINEIRKNLPKCILDNLEISSSELTRIEFVNKGMTKVKAIELLINKLDIDKANIIAIGDGENDINMIRYAVTGIAMLNSPEIVKENADIVTKYSNKEDEFYYVIKELLSEGSDNMNENKTNINCLITIYLRTYANPYFIRDYKKIDNACFI